MATTVPCPHCRHQITLPDGASPDHRFLCPLCEAAFDVAEAMSAPDEAAAPAAQPTEKAPLQVEFVGAIDALRQETALPRRPRRSNWFGHLVGIVGGGLIGLTAGYLLLLKLRGPEADFLHVAEQLPPWAGELLSLPPPRPDEAK